MQGPQQVRQECKYLLKPSSPKKPEQISEWIHEWEDKAGKLSLVSAAHSFPDELRRNMFYEAMPKQVQDSIDAERRKGALITHSDTRKWLLSQGTQSML